MDTPTVTGPEPTAPNEPAATPAASEAAPTAETPAPGTASSRAPWLVAAVLAATTLVASIGWMTSSGDDGRGEVRDAAITFVLELTTWDAADGLGDTVAALRDLGTGDFLDQVDEVLGEEARATAEAVGARSSGEVTDVFVSEIDGDRAVAIVIVTQRIEVDGQTGDQEQVSRIEFTRVDGRWLVSRSELLNAPVVGAGTEVEP